MNVCVFVLMYAYKKIFKLQINICIVYTVN